MANDPCSLFAFLPAEVLERISFVPLTTGVQAETSESISRNPKMSPLCRRRTSWRALCMFAVGVACEVQARGGRGGGGGGRGGGGGGFSRGGGGGGGGFSRGGGGGG